MSKKLNLLSKKSISLILLCATAPFVVSQDANAILGRVGGAARNLGNNVRNSIRRSSTSSIASRSSRINTVRSGSSTSNLVSSSVGNSKLNELSQKVQILEANRDLEIQKNNHKLNKAIVVSGLISSGALVAGVVGGIIQQSKFTKLSQEQAEKDQDVQEDLNVRKKYFQNKEIPEAEQYIIDYYKENYGIDISKK